MSKSPITQKIDETPITKQNKFLQNLQKSVNYFLELPKLKDFTNQDVGLFYGKLFADLGFDIRNCELAGIPRDKILAIIDPVIQILKSSPFAKRTFEWPRGYPGDFQTIEDMYNHRNRAKPGTLSFIIEQHALNSAMTQQHRYKLMHQAAMLKETILEKKDSTRILILGCGGCGDLASIQEVIQGYQPTIYLNDMDKDALKRAKENCPAMKKLIFIEDNCLKTLRHLQKEEGFDLVLAGGLLDYFDTERTQRIISLVLKLLKPNGKFFFTNIAKGHSYRIFMEYLSNWFLIEKSDAELIAACVAAHADRHKIEIKREETGLTYMVTVKK